MGTYGCFSDGALAQLVEVDEELPDADAILGDASLNPLLDVVLVAEGGRVALVVALVAVGR